MNKDNLLNLKNRKLIFDFISEFPGMHLRKIIKEIDLSEGTIRYHINYLLKHELIFKQSKNGYTRYYILDSNNIKNKKIISYLRNDNTRSIILFFCFDVICSLKTICKALNKDKKEVSNYINMLLKDNIIEVAPIEGSVALTGFKRIKKMRYDISCGEKIYRLKNPYELDDILISLKNKYFDNGTTDAILDLLHWFYVYKDGRPKTMKSNKEVCDDLTDFFFELFPNPYCC